MRTVYAGLATAVLVIAVPAPRPAEAMPIQTNLATVAAGMAAPTEVQYRRRYYRGGYRGYRGWGPRYRYVRPYPYYYGGYYPYRSYGYYPYSSYGYYAPGAFFRFGPIGFGFGGW
jgi:hypothetical protein